MAQPEERLWASPSLHGHTAPPSDGGWELGSLCLRLQETRSAANHHLLRKGHPLRQLTKASWGSSAVSNPWPHGKDAKGRCLFLGPLFSARWAPRHTILSGSF